MQVKETDDVVLASAYVDLHEATVASPEEMIQVCHAEQPFPFHQSHSVC